MHEVFYGGVQFLPSVLPACAERAVLGAVVITYITPSFLISGPYSTLFVICWLGGGLNCVQASGSGRKGNAWETAVCIVLDINFHLNMGSHEILTSE